MSLHLLATIIGYAGGIAVLIGFGAMSAGRLGARSVTAHAVNLGGGLALAASASYAGAWPSFTVNIVWSGISAVGLLAMRRPMTFEPPTAELSVINR